MIFISLVSSVLSFWNVKKTKHALWWSADAPLLPLKPQKAAPSKVVDHVIYIYGLLERPVNCDLCFSLGCIWAWRRWKSSSSNVLRGSFSICTCSWISAPMKRRRWCTRLHPEIPSGSVFKRKCHIFFLFWGFFFSLRCEPLPWLFWSACTRRTISGTTSKSLPWTTCSSWFTPTLRLCSSGPTKTQVCLQHALSSPA